MGNQFNKEDLNKALDGMSGNIKPGEADKIRSVINGGSLDGLLGSLKPSDTAKLQQVLSDKEATKKMLSSPQAQMLLKKLMEDKKK